MANFEPNPSQLAAMNSGITTAKRVLYDSYETTKQARLNDEQMDAVNSGITEEKRVQYDNYEFLKQGKLNDDQLNAVNSGITSLKRQKYDLYENTKQDTLTAEQLKVVNSGITKDTLDNIITTFNTVAAKFDEQLKAISALSKRVAELEKIVNGGTYES